MTGFKESFSAPASKQYLNKSNEQSKVAKYLGTPTRIATMPLGMIKDFANGGIVGMTKNIGPRIKNIGKGDNFINHAQGKKIIPTEENKEQK
jgi:hypothetical protein